MDNQKITKNKVILYHADCNDGFGGAWAAWKKFGDEADYIPIEHQMPLPEGLKDKQIFFIDIVPDEATLKKVINDNTTVIGIDHHKTSEAKMYLFKEHSFDNNHSGSVLAWKYFHSDKPVPKLLLFVEDSDLWKSEYLETGKFIVALGLFDFNFRVWDKIAEDLESSEKINDYLKKGEVILDYEEKLINYLEKQAQLVEFLDYKVYAINAPRSLRNSIAHVLYKRLPPFAISWMQEKDKIHVSLRSDGLFDVSEIAKKYGGGGHKAAAGFSFPAEQGFPWKIIKEDIKD